MVFKGLCVLGLILFIVAKLDIGAYADCLDLVDAGVRSAYYCEYSVK